MIKYTLVALLLTSALSADDQACPADYFFDIQHCQTCTANCICTSENTCLECVPGYTMFNGACMQCPQSSGIYGTCTGCCSRTDGTILSCTDCQVVAGYYSFLFSGRCISSQGCFEVDANGFCQHCLTGFYPHDNLCYACDTSCATCQDSDNCLTCASGYYWKVANGGLCSACPTGCATCSQSDSSTLCQSCLSQYYLHDDHCLSCPTNCDVCLDGSTCTTCASGILVSSLCIGCTDTTYGGSTGCLKCSEVNNFIECTECDATYFLDTDNGICRLCSDFITGASRCKDENTPTQCLNDYDPVLTNRYYLVGISCVANTKSCKKIADIHGNCSECYSGYKMDNSACVQCSLTGCVAGNTVVVANVCSCTLCQVGYYLNGAECTACSTSECSSCPGDVCASCKTGFYFNAGTCPSATVTNCLEGKPSSATLCTTCNNGYYLGTDEMCYQCQTNCEMCSDRFTCTQCAANYYLLTGVCVVYPSNCVQVLTPVSSSGLECKLCQHGYYLVNGFCKECSVAKGTLSSCQGLCPIDYYIESLLPSTVSHEWTLMIWLCTMFFLMMML